MVNHFELVREALARLDHAAIERAIEIIRQAKERGSMVFICGNGGSAATASHFACDLQKAAGVRAIALTDNVPLITAWANDREYTESFSGQLRRLFSIDDVLILLSCSGYSENTLDILDWPNADTVFLTSVIRGDIELQIMEENRLNVIRVQSEDYGVIEDVHLSICHAITKGVRDASI